MIKVGDVIYTFIEEFSKNKYFIILGESDTEFTFATFYINTDINYNFVNNTEIEKFHVLLKKCYYPFLNYDSYLNLNQLFPKSKKALLEVFSNKNCHIVYSLSEEQLYFLRKLYREQSTVKGKLLKKYNFFEK